MLLIVYFPLSFSRNNLTNILNFYVNRATPRPRKSCNITASPFICLKILGYLIHHLIIAVNIIATKSRKKNILMKNIVRSAVICACLPIVLLSFQALSAAASCNTAILCETFFRITSEGNHKSLPSCHTFHFLLSVSFVGSFSFINSGVSYILLITLPVKP